MTVPASNPTEGANCSTTSPCRSHLRIEVEPALPLSTATGLNEDRTKSGYNPASSVPAENIVSAAAHNLGFVHAQSVSCVPARLFTKGLITSVNATAKTRAAT